VLSWLFSFFFPGVGQLYCGYQTRGWITFFIFWFAVAYTFAFSTSTWQWRMALRYAMALWCFATLDAFFTSREINSGIATLIEGENPRVAAILNLMTKGWGYFYLGRKGVGIATFILLTIADLTIRSLHGHTARLASLAAEFILLGLSAHAYYLALCHFAAL
jgi:TM2 domain-containing membrane protein YozV